MSTGVLRTLSVHIPSKKFFFLHKHVLFDKVLRTNFEVVAVLVPVLDSHPHAGWVVLRTSTRPTSSVPIVKGILPPLLPFLLSSTRYVKDVDQKDERRRGWPETYTSRGLGDGQSNSESSTSETPVPTLGAPETGLSFPPTMVHTHGPRNSVLPCLTVPAGIGKLTFGK